jgi:hypothetical protein
MRDGLRELREYERFQKAIFEGVQEAARDTERNWVPYGRCRRHPHIPISNGMFDAPCNLCEAENE